MQIIIHSSKGIKAAEIFSKEIEIDSLDVAFKVITDIQKTYDSQKIIIHQHHLCDDFFDSSTMLAGKVLKILMDAEVQLSVIGDYSDIEDKKFLNFIKDCNNNNKNILFFDDISDALDEIF